jgi:hypothetical protein
VTEIVAILDGQVFLLNLMEDFEEFISWLDHLQYFSRQEFIAAATEAVALPKISKSSAKRR